LVGAARSHAQTLDDQIESLEGELLDISRQERGGIVFKQPQEPDLQWIWWWLNEPSVQSLLPATFPALEDFTNQYDEWRRAEDQRPLAIYLATGDLIGFLLMSKQDRLAVMDLIIMCPDYWDQGYGTDVVTAAMQLAFEHLDAEVFAIEVDLNHGPALRCFEKCGLKFLLKETETVQESDQGTHLLGLHQDDWFRRMDQFETTRTVWSPDQQMKITLGDFGDLGDR
jgi:RimJ/RimL family protein N-acetyltransferase